MMFSMSIKSIVNKMIAVFEDNGQKEYSKLIMDAGAGINSSSVMAINGFSIVVIVSHDRGNNLFRL